MEQFKIENYNRQRGRGGAFPEFRHLLPEEAGMIREEIIDRLGLPKSTSPLDLVKTVYARSTLLSGVVADCEQFELSRLFKNLELKTARINLNWYRYDDIDEMNTSDLFTHFHDIWYPSVDDLDIIDPGMRWILLIEHFGAVRILYPPK